MRQFSLRSISVFIVGGVCALSPLWAQAQCTPQWQSGHQLPGVTGEVHASVVFDDGSGPKLYIAGIITKAGGGSINGVGRWNGSSWESVGEPFYNALPNGIAASLNALAIYNGHLYVGGNFRYIGSADGGSQEATGIARLDGSSWQPINGALINFPGHDFPIVSALTVYNGELIIGGTFDTVDFGPIATGLAKWNSTTNTLSILGPGSSLGGFPEVFALTTYGSDLIVGGSFASAGGAPNTAGIAKWNGTAFSSMGSVKYDPTNGFFEDVRCLTTFDDDGNGPHGATLIAGGRISTIGIGLGGSPGVEAAGIAQWNGTSWSAMGAGQGDSIGGTYVYGLGVYDAGNGPKLYVGARRGSDGYPVSRWNGVSWDVVGTGGFAFTLTPFDFDGPGGNPASLFIGGAFNNYGPAASPVVAVNVAKFNGTSWSSVPAASGAATWTRQGVTAGTCHYVFGDEDGAGSRPPALYAYGDFSSIGATNTPNRLARLDGSSWTSIGTVANGPQSIRQIVFYDDNSGSGTRMFAVTDRGELWKWTGSAWALVLQFDIGSSGQVVTAAVFDDDGAGVHRPAIYVSGNFYGPDSDSPVGPVFGGPKIGMFKWDGTAITVASSATTPGHVDPAVVGVMTVYNNALYAGGTFWDVGTTSGGGSGLARWDGTNWTIVGSGSGVGALEIFQGKLYVGGSFNSFATATTKGLVSFDGTTWSNVGDVTRQPVSGLPVGAVSALRVGNDGSGVALFIGGQLDAVNGAPMRGITKWNGSTFSSLNTGLTYDSATGNPPVTVRGIVSDLGAVGNLIYVSGQFNHAGSALCYSTSAWGCAAQVCVADHNHSGTVTVQDIFSFLSAWFAGNLSADANASGMVTVQDIFFFLSRWFAGC